MSESVLIVQPGFLGDAVLASGLVRAVRQTMPDAEIGLLVRSAYTSLFQGHPAIKHIHGLDKKQKGGSRQMIEILKEAGYHLALIPHRSARSQHIPYRAGIVRRIGFRQSALSLLCTDRVEYNIARHELQRNLSLLEKAGISAPPGAERSWLVPDPVLVAQFNATYRNVGPLVVIAPGSVWPTKCWPEEYVSELCRKLYADGKEVVLIGSPGELALCRRIAARGGIPKEGVLAGDLSLAEVAALLSVATQVVVNDSAPLHIAESVGTPVTAIFGPTVPEFGFSPYLPASSLLEKALPCRPCGIHGHHRCPIVTHECMRSIGVEEVMDVLNSQESSEV